MLFDDHVIISKMWLVMFRVNEKNQTGNDVAAQNDYLEENRQVLSEGGMGASYCELASSQCVRTK